MAEDPIRLVDTDKADMASYGAHLADAVVVTRDGKLLLQQRPLNWGKAAGALNAFGGHVDPGETVMEALVRELNEELGAVVKPEEVVFLGAMTEEFTGHTELVHMHFWHDREGTITGCYEAEAREYGTVAEALSHPKLMDYARWGILECQKRGLLGCKFRSL